MNQKSEGGNGSERTQISGSEHCSKSLSVELGMKKDENRQLDTTRPSDEDEICFVLSLKLWPFCFHFISFVAQVDFEHAGDPRMA